MSENRNTNRGSQILYEANAFASANGMKAVVEGMTHGANARRSRTIDATRGAGAFSALKLPNGKALGKASQGDLVRFGQQLGIPVSHEQGYTDNIGAWHDWLVLLAMHAVEDKLAELFAAKGGV